MKDESWLPRVGEPMAEYLMTNRYRESASEITFSNFRGQEETNYMFWRHLTPSQRLELHTIMTASLYVHELEKNTDKHIFEIEFNVHN